MHRRARFRWWLSLMIVAAMALAGCANEQPDTLALGDALSPPQTTRIRIATSDPIGLLAGIAEWERSHPTARVEIDVRNPDDLQRSILESLDAPSSDAPDIVAMGPSIRPTLTKTSGSFIDLEPFVSEIERNEHAADFWNSIRSPTNELLGAPAYTNALALTARTDLFSAEQLDALRSADGWCAVLRIADGFSEDTNTAFLGTATELAQAQFAQTRTNYVDDAFLDATERAELERIWDMSMATLGHDAIHGDPCPDDEPIERISRNFSAGDDQWAASARVDGFAAAIISHRDLDELAAAAPSTSGRWTTLPLPTETGASDETVHLGVLATTEHAALAIDLVTSLASPELQLLAHREGAPILPTTRAIADVDTDDPFYGDNALGPFIDAVGAAPSDAATAPERRLVIEEMLSGIQDVANGAQSPREAWDSTLERIELISR